MTEQPWFVKKPCQHCPFRRDVKPFLTPERAEEIAGAKEVLENGGEVRILSFRDGHSSTRIIDRMRD